MNITCGSCSKPLGEIRDGKLRNGIVHLCKECAARMRAAEMLQKFRGKSSGAEVPDFLRTILRR